MHGGMKTILLVEDEAVIALSEKLTLERFGYTVVIAASGEKAIETFSHSADVDLILMDINLGSGMDGSQAAEIILRERDVPIVFLSSHTDPAIVEKTEKITSYGYIVKNSAITVLDASIKMAFRLFDAKQKAKRDSEVIYERNQLLENIMENFPGSVFWKDTNSVYLGCNTSEARTAGLESPEEIVGKSDYDLAWKDSGADAYRNTDRVVIESGRPLLHIEEINRRENGEPVWMDTNKVPLFDSAGNISGVFGVSIDITERKRAEEALRESERGYRSLFENAPVGVFYSTAQGKIIRVNDEYARIFGYASAEETKELINESSAAELLFDDPRDRAQLVDEAMGSPGRWIRSERTYRRKDGSHIVTNLFFRALPEEPTVMEGFLEDISERKRAEASLQESNTLLSAIAGAAQDAIVMMNQRGEIDFWNPAAERIFGYTRAEAMGKNLHELLAPERYHKRIDAAIARFRSSGRGEAIGKISEIEARTKDGSEIIAELSLSPIAIENGWQAVGFVRNIGERKRDEERIRALLAEKEIILREVHHRIRNNMTTIQGLLTLQAGTMEDPRATAGLVDASSRVRSMMLLYDKLYDSADFSSMSVLDYLSPLIDEIIGSFPNGGSVRVVKEIGAFTLDSKKLQPLGLIINELLTNIMKYAFVGGACGEIRVSASMEGSAVSLRIHDNGKGIPASIDFEHSTGFGLKLVGALAKQVGGTIRIERGGGTTFVLEFEKPAFDPT